jgi:hypothetical protein
MTPVDLNKGHCDCNACKQRRAGLISPVTGRVPGTHMVRQLDERDPRVVAASKRIREEEGG